MKKIIMVTLVTMAMVTAVFGYKASKTIRIHQNKCPNATDLHFTTYQKESNIHINGYNISVSGFSKVNTTPHDNGVGDGQTHGVDVDCDGGSVPYCEYVTVQVEFDLSNFNTVRFKDIDWTCDCDGDPDTPPDYVPSGVPNLGFAIDYIDSQGNSTYWFYNDDSVTLVVSNFRVARNQTAYLPPNKLFNFTAWTDFFPDFVVPPYTYYAIPLQNMQVGLFTYVAYDASVQGLAFNSEIEVLESTEVHEDQTVGVVEPLNIEEMGLLQDTKILDVAAYPGYSEIKYQLPRSSHTNLTIYSLTGERVTVLVDEIQCAGGHTLRWEGDGLPTGLYIARLSADGIQASEKMVRLK